jgi:hypothetical protein
MPSSVSLIALGWPGRLRISVFPAHHADLARQDRGRHVLQADLAHLLAEARQHLVRHRQRGFRRHVARRRAGAAGGHDQVAAGRVAQLDQGPLDQRLLVGDQAVLHAPGRGQRCAEPLAQGGNALVLVDAAGGAVGDRHQADQQFAHSFIVVIVDLPQQAEQFAEGARRLGPLFFLERVAAQLAQLLQVGAGVGRGRSRSAPPRLPAAARAGVPGGAGARLDRETPLTASSAARIGAGSTSRISGRCTAAGGGAPRAW